MYAMWPMPTITHCYHLIGRHHVVQEDIHLITVYGKGLVGYDFNGHALHIKYYVTPELPDCASQPSQAQSSPITNLWATSAKRLDPGPPHGAGMAILH